MRKTLVALAFVAVAALAAPETANAQLLRRGGRGGSATTSGGCGTMSSGMVVSGGTVQGSMGGAVVMGGIGSTTMPTTGVIYVQGGSYIVPGTGTVIVGGTGTTTGTTMTTPGTGTIVVDGQMPFQPNFTQQGTVPTTTGGRFFRRGNTTTGTARIFQGRTLRGGSYR